MMHTNDHPLVSVCIQTYQHADYIRECLESALRQETNFPVEIIVGEDDSTDGTRDICSEYAARYQQIRLFLRSEKDKIYINGEKTGRFNFTENMKAARGKYIALLDGDDYWGDKNKLQLQTDFMDANPDCSMSFHKVLRCWERGQPYVSDHPGLPAADTKFTIDDLLKENMIAASSCMFLRSNVEQLPRWFYELPFIDYALHVHNAQKGKIGFIARHMAVYRNHRRGMWSSALAPRNHVRSWRLFSILATNTNGDIGNALLAKRYREGLKLVQFYKTHLWEKRSWFKEEISQRKLQYDEELLRQLQTAPGVRDYLLNGVYYAKRIVKKLFSTQT